MRDWATGARRLARAEPMEPPAPVMRRHLPSRESAALFAGTGRGVVPSRRCQAKGSKPGDCGAGWRESRGIGLMDRFETGSLERRISQTLPCPRLAQPPMGIAGPQMANAMGLNAISWLQGFGGFFCVLVKPCCQKNRCVRTDGA